MDGKPTIVVLEDDLSLSDLMAEGLRHEGYTVIPASDAGLATRAVEDLGGRAILVADRSVGPGPPTGFDVARATLERHPALKVIYVSGTHLAVKHRRLSGRERSLLKPFALSQLVELVEQLS